MGVSNSRTPESGRGDSGSLLLFCFMSELDFFKGCTLKLLGKARLERRMGAVVFVAERGVFRWPDLPWNFQDLAILAFPADYFVPPIPPSSWCDVP